MVKENWPVLSFDDAKDTYEMLHLCTQIAGKIKLAKMPWINHSWHVALYVTPFGLTTGDIPDADKHFQVNFDLLQHRLQILTSNREEESFSLNNISVSECYSNILAILQKIKVQCEINPIPNEIPDALPFYSYKHESYSPNHATDLHKALLKVNDVFTQFRAGFTGKCSPVHFFWGSFDLAVTRFSGREAPDHPGGIPNMPDWVAREAYSHEVSSCGFWPGNEMVPFAAFYSYAYPEPKGYKKAAVKPASAYYHNDLGEFILRYDEVQQADNPSQMLLDFLNSTYEAAANLANWERQKLEKKITGNKG